MCSEYAVSTDIPPATASLAMNYRAPIKTPGIVLARATVSKVDGRKVWVKAAIEDGKGGVFADGEALYIIARPKI
jgi:thioesterase superfamily protein 4